MVAPTRNPGIPWDLDPDDPTQSEGVVLAYRKVIEKIFKEFIKEIRGAHLNLTNQTAYLVNANPFDTVGIEATVGSIADGVMGSNADNVVTVTIKAYEHGQNFSEALLKSAGQAPFSIGKWDQTHLDALTANLGGSIVKVTDEVKTGVARAVNAGLLANEGEYKITKRIEGVLGDFKDAYPRRAETIARTESLDALNTGAHDYIRDRGYKKFRVLTAGDDRSCDQCLDMQGVEYDIDDTAHIPPFHPLCRCTIVPVIQGLNDADTLKKVYGKNQFMPETIAPAIKAKLVEGFKSKFIKPKTTVPTKAKTVIPDVKPAVEPAASPQKVSSPTTQKTTQTPKTSPAAPQTPVKPQSKVTSSIDGLTADESEINDIDSPTRGLYKLDDVVKVTDEKHGAEVVDAWSNYTGGGYTSMNKVLRGKAGSLSDMEVDFARRNIKELEKVMTEKIPAGVLYRGVGIRTGKEMISAKIGTICKDAGFQSHSIGTEASSYFAKTIYKRDPKTGAVLYGKGGAVLRRDKVMIRALSDGNQIGIRGTEYESEVIIKPGTKWKIIDKAQIEAGSPSSPVFWHIITVVPA